jgi:hypothetical protein
MRKVTLTPYLLEDFQNGPPRRLIDVDKYATGAVHDGFSSALDFCAETAMTGEQNSKSEKAQP